MNDFYSDTPIHKLTLSLRPEGCLIADPDLAEQIRHLPEVFRVESNAGKMEMTVWFVEPAEGLLAATNNLLRDHGNARARRAVFLRGNIAFTLIELMAVMTIIAILAALVIGIASHAQRKGASSEAQVTIKTIESAIENSRLDNGAYPTSSTVRGSTMIEATTNSWLLYYQITLGSNTAGKIYFTPTAKQIQSTGTLMYFTDPYGNPYNYFCRPDTLSSQTNKTTFDIWSYGADSTDSTYDDITNWK